MILILLFFLIISCEKDDICLEGSLITNRVSIGFINIEYQDTTSISLKNVRGLNKDSIIHTNIGTDKLRLPLNISSNKTKYILNYNDEFFNDTEFNMDCLLNVNEFGSK